MKKDGLILTTLLDEAKLAGGGYDEEALRAVYSTVEQLAGKKTSNDHPGILLGNIQSGKTKTFLGAIALAADNDFKQFIVLTKGTKALTTQTYERLKKAFETVIDLDELRVFDIMSFPKLTVREQNLPIIIVVKKEKRNLERLKKLFVETYPSWATRRTLIIDDEADFASVGFKRSKAEQVELQTIMGQIDEVRTCLANSAFLQVTATPYSLYLQPNADVSGNSFNFNPVRPAFTVLVPIHDAYIGGKYYFEDSQTPNTPPFFLYKPVDLKELEVLHHADRRRFKPEEALTSNSVPVLRQAIVTFAVGGMIRKLQAKQNREKPKKFSFIIHTESARQAHAWQELVVDSIIEKLRLAVSENDPQLNNLIRASYDDLSVSINAGKQYLPPFADVLVEVHEHLDAIQVEKVNSEKDVLQLLDRDGQLELRNQLNIFIGGQILDRGLTIGNLIGFYYGRRANRFQQDTVLQHARMYGARPVADLCVTRFYTSKDIYEVLKRIHEFDRGLRERFERGQGDQAIVFIQKDAKNKIVPCSPNKLLLSTTTTLRPGKRLLPVGFQTGPKSKIAKTIEKLDATINQWLTGSNHDSPTLVNLNDVLRVIDEIASTFIDDEEKASIWDVAAFKASLEFYGLGDKNSTSESKVYVLVRTGRKNVRIREGGRPFDAPDTSHVEGEIARKFSKTIPMLMLFRQEGTEDLGWRGTPFWWPVLFIPTERETVVFAKDILEYDEDVASLD